MLGQLKDDHYPIEDIKNICIRFFPDIHTNERSTPTPSYGHRTRQALITTPVPVAPADPRSFSTKEPKSIPKLTKTGQNGKKKKKLPR